MGTSWRHLFNFFGMWWEHHEISSNDGIIGDSSRKVGVPNGMKFKKSTERVSTWRILGLCGNYSIKLTKWMAQYYKNIKKYKTITNWRAPKQVHELILQLLGFAHKWEQWLTMIVCTAGFCLCSWPSFRQTHLSVRFAGSFLSLGLWFGPEARFGHSSAGAGWSEFSFVVQGRQNDEKG